MPVRILGEFTTGDRWTCSRGGIPCPVAHVPGRRAWLLPRLFTVAPSLRTWRFGFCGTDWPAACGTASASGRSRPSRSSGALAAVSRRIGENRCRHRAAFGGRLAEARATIHGKAKLSNFEVWACQVNTMVGIVCGIRCISMRLEGTRSAESKRVQGVWGCRAFAIADLKITNRVEPR